MGVDAEKLSRQEKRSIVCAQCHVTYNIPKDKVGLGSTVKVFDNDKNEEMEYNLVTSEESDVAAGKISTTSPIGRALLNKKVGDTATVVTPAGKREMEILKLTTIHDP